MPKRPDFKKIVTDDPFGDLDNDNTVERLTGQHFRHGQLINLPVKDLVPDPDQPRQITSEDQAELSEMASTMRTGGVIQPLVIRPIGDGAGKFLILGGHRRHRAALIAELTAVPAIVNLDGDKEEVQLIENIQRKDLHPIDEARALARYRDSHNLNGAQVAQRLGKGARAVEEIISLTNLPDQILDEARATAEVKKTQLLQVLRVDGFDAQMALWESIRDGKFSSREAKAARKTSKRKDGPKPFTHKHVSTEKNVTVTVKFRKSHADSAEIREVLQEVIDNLT